MISPERALFPLYPASDRPVDEPESLGNAGGLSGSKLWRFHSSRGQLVLRRWPADGPTPAHLLQVHVWLARAGDLGFIPVPVATLDGRTLVEFEGHSWELTPWMPGRADLDRPPSAVHLRAGFAGLAAFHARLGAGRSEGPSPGLLARADEVDRLIRGEFGSLRDAVARGSADPIAGLASRWLDRAFAFAPGISAELRNASTIALPLQPCLRDARPDHFLFEGGRLTGLVDFGAMGRDSVAGDLARLIAEWLGTDRLVRAEALAAYESIRPLATAERRAFEAFERANALLGAGRWVRWRFVEGRTFEDPEAVERGLRRGIERLESLTRPTHM